MSTPLPGIKRIALGVVLLIAGAIVSSLNLYVSDLIFYTGLAVTVWGAYAYFKEKETLRQLHSPEAYRDHLRSIYATIPSPPSTPHLGIQQPPPPPPLAAQSRPFQTGIQTAEESTTPYTYAVEFTEGETQRTTVFATFNPAHQFYLNVKASPKRLVRTSRDGQRQVLLPSPIPTSISPIPTQRKLEPIAPDPQLDRVSAFIDQYRPSRRFSRENEFQIELSQALRSHFGNANVRWEVPVGEGRIDLEVFGVGIELKIAGSTKALLDLPEQASKYREEYGPNLMLVILDDTGGGERVQDLRRFLSGQGIRVYIK